MKMNRIISYFMFIFVVIVLFLSLRGISGNPSKVNINSPMWTEKGPFEMSPERGRFALTFSLIEDHSFNFDIPIARFVVPDLAISREKYVSLFAPLVSFIVMPGYIVGKYFNASQVGTFAIVSLFALFNFLLVRSISLRLGANNIASALGAFVFLFASPAFVYAVTLYQHHLSTFLILMSIYILLRFKNAWSLFLTFFLCALAIPLDYPNLFFLFPIGVFALFRIFAGKYQRNLLKVQISFIKFLTIFAMVLPILFFLWFNQMSYGDAFQISGTLKTVKGIGDDGRPLSAEQLANLPGRRFEIKDLNRKKELVKFFNTRSSLNGFYTHFASPDRGIIYFTPVILLGILGLFLAYRKRVEMVPLFVAIIGANVLLYSMWGDPWGGWAFGSRYLIPSYAILAIFISLLLTYWRKNILLLIIFLILFSYSTAVNTLGAITSSANPPQSEVLELEKLSGLVQKYTWERNWDFLVSGNSKSFVFQTYAKKYLNSVQYYQILVWLIICSVLYLTALLWFFRKENE